MKKFCGWDLRFVIYLLFGICYLGFTALAVGCGQTSSPATTTTTSTSTTSTTIAPAGNVTIRGSIYSGTIRTSALKAKASGIKIMAEPDAPITSVQVVAVGTIDNKTYFSSKTDSSGNFTIPNLPSSESYYLELIDSNKKFAAPVAFGSTADSKVIMGITPEAGSNSINLGQIVYESGKGAAVPTKEVASGELDNNSTAKQKLGESFVPVGTGLNLGRGTGEAKFDGTLKDKVDEDNDGIPDVIDIDDNGNGTVDGLDQNPRLAGRVEVKVANVDHANAFSNLPLQYENYPTYINGSLNPNAIDIGTNTNLAIEVIMPSGTLPTVFSSIKVIEGPAWIDTAKLSSDCPPEKVGTLWKDSNYTLYSSTDRWTVHVTPHGTPEAGDIIKFMTTDPTGATQEFISTLTYIFKDVPKLVGYALTGGTLTTREGAAWLDLSVYQANSNTLTYEGNSIMFIWIAPKDDLGNYITGMTSYLDGIVYYRGGSNFSGGSIQINPTTLESYPIFGTAYGYIFTPTTEAFDYFKVDIKSQSPVSGGGNASQMVNFKKI